MTTASADIEDHMTAASADIEDHMTAASANVEDHVTGDIIDNQARCQLSDTTSYCPLDHDPTSDHEAIISQTIDNLITSGDLLSTASNLIVPQLCRNPNTQPTFMTQPMPFTFTKAFNSPASQHLIFTMDVQSLYTCGSHMEGLKALHFFLS
eukprot:g43164.t1